MKFKNHLENIKVTLMDYPTIEQLESYIPEFCGITWMDEMEDIDKVMKERGLDRNGMVMEMFNYRTLPTALETVRLTFVIEGLTVTDVTHLIRHRLFSYSAQASDPKPTSSYDILENDAFLEDEELTAKSRQLCQDAEDLYALALEKGLTYFDARHYAIRAKESKYFVSGNIKDIIMYLRTRLGRMNQPTSDNIIAMRIRQAILKVYPFLKDKIPSQEVQWIYLKNVKEKMNVNTFPPDAFHREAAKKAGIDFEGVKFAHDKPRDEYSHMDKFEKLFKKIEEDS